MYCGGHTCAKQNHHFNQSCLLRNKQKLNVCLRSSTENKRKPKNSVSVYEFHNSLCEYPINKKLINIKILLYIVLSWLSCRFCFSSALPGAISRGVDGSLSSLCSVLASGAEQEREQLPLTSQPLLCHPLPPPPL